MSGQDLYFEKLSPEQQDRLRRIRILNQNVKKGEILFTGSSLMEQFPINELQLTTNSIYIKRMIIVMALMFCLLTVPGCSSSGKTVEEDTIYTEIMTSENLPIDKAYEKLKNNSSTNSEQTEFIQRLKDLNDCSGKFANTTERGNV